MSKDSFPANIESVTNEWLTRVIKSNDLITAGSVLNFVVEPINGGGTSSVYRLLLEYEEGGSDEPPSLILKLHATSTAKRESFEAFGIYEIEVRFYQNLEKNHTLPVPICYAAEFDKKTGGFVLLLEDLSEARPGSWQDDPLSDVRIAIPHLAKIHAKYWGDPQLLQYDWVAQPTNLNSSLPLKELWATNLAQVKAQYHDELSEYTWMACDRWSEFWDEIMMCMSLDTHTLVHTDPHLGQMFFPTEKLPRFVIFDWQFPSISWGAEDITYLMVTSLSPEDRCEHEESLVTLYYESLCNYGVRDLTKERLWFQCKLSLLWLYFTAFNFAVVSHLDQPISSEAESSNEAWRKRMFNVIESATEDWRLVEILELAREETRIVKKR